MSAVWEDLSINWHVIKGKKDLPPEGELFWAYLNGRKEQIMYGDYCGKFIQDDCIQLLVRSPDSNGVIECRNLDGTAAYHWRNEELISWYTVKAWAYYDAIKEPKDNE